MHGKGEHRLSTSRQGLGERERVKQVSDSFRPLIHTMKTLSPMSTVSDTSHCIKGEWLVMKDLTYLPIHASSELGQHLGRQS